MTRETGQGRAGLDFSEEQKCPSTLQTRKKQSSSPHHHIPPQQTLPQNVTDWREASHCLISIQQHHRSTWGMEAASREKARHGSALHVPSAALVPSPPWHAQDAGTRHGPQMARRGTGTRIAHVALSLHTSPCQLQHSGLGKGKGGDGCTDRLNHMNPPCGSEANGLTPRFPLPFPALTHCRLLFLTLALGGRLELARERIEQR